MKHFIQRFFWHTALFLLALILATTLAGCAQSQAPQLIAAYPSEKYPSPPSVLPPAQFVYDTYLILDVSSVSRAAEQAQEAAAALGGYLVSSNAWYQQNQKTMTLVLAVPAPNFEALRSEVLRLGNLQNEQISGRWVDSYGRDWSAYSQVTLQLQPKKLALPNLPDLPNTGWNPGRTLRSALGVFLSIFGFLADIVIWLLVVVGPFVLLGWVGLKLAKRLRRG